MVDRGGSVVTRASKASWAASKASDLADKALFSVVKICVALHHESFFLDSLRVVSIFVYDHALIVSQKVDYLISLHSINNTTDDANHTLTVKKRSAN